MTEKENAVNIASPLIFAERIVTDNKKDKPKSTRFVNAAEPEFDPISAALRQMHDGVAKEPVPEDFLKLLDQLDERLADKDTEQP